METNLSGTLDDEGYCDTYELWRKAGRYRYEARVRGSGAVRFLLEVHQPPEESDTDAGDWRPLAEAPRVAGGSRASGTATVPEVRLSASVPADWVLLRLRFSRVAGTASVAYEFSMEPEAQRPLPAGPADPSG